MLKGSAQQRGIDFEKYVAEKLGGKLQPGSGNKFYAKSDVSANGLLVSCKSETKITWLRITKYLNEATDMAFQTGQIGILVTEDAEDWNQDPIVMMRLSDFTKALAEEIKIPVNHDSKGIQKRSTAEVPLMLRG